MPASYRIHPANRLVLVTLEGILTEADLTAHLAQVLADPAFDPAYDQVVDGRTVTSIDLSSAFIRRLAEEDPFQGESRRALVVSSDAAYGMARMFQNLAARGDSHMIVLRDMDEACRWLGLHAR